MTLFPQVGAQAGLLVALLVAASFVTLACSSLIEVDSVTGLQQALADQQVTDVHVIRDLTISESDWPEDAIVEVASGRNITVTGGCAKPSENWAFIDFGLVQNRLQLHKGTWLVFECLWIGNYRWSLTVSPGTSPIQ